MEEIERRFQALEGALQAAEQRVQAAEERALAAESAAASAGAAASRPVAAARAAPQDLVDTRLLAKPKAFGGSEDEWPGWSFKMLAYLGALDEMMANELTAAMTFPLEEVRNARLLEEGASQRSRQLYFILVLLLEGAALQLIKPVGVGEGYRAWRTLQDMYEPDRPGRHAGLLQELIAFQFPEDNIVGTLADFDFKVTKYESQSHERIGDRIKMAILQRGIQDEALRAHLVHNASRLTTWELMRNEVHMVISTRSAISAVPPPVPMDTSAVEKARRERDKGKGKKGKEGKGRKGKGGDNSTDQRSQAAKDRAEKRCFHCHKTGHVKNECRKFLAEQKKKKGTNAVEQESKPTGAPPAASAAGSAAPVMAIATESGAEPLWCLAIELEEGQESSSTGAAATPLAPATTAIHLRSSEPSNEHEQPRQPFSVGANPIEQLSQPGAANEHETFGSKEIIGINEHWVMVDSGAARSVCPPSHGAHETLRDLSERIRLVGASGDDIPCHGERFVTYTKDGHKIGVDYKVADVKRPVLGVSQAVDKGTSWVFTPSGSYMIPKPIEFSDPDAVPLVRRNDLFYLKMDKYGEGVKNSLVMPVRGEEPGGEAGGASAASRAAARAALQGGGGGGAAATHAQAEASEPAAQAVLEESVPVRVKKDPVKPSLAEQRTHELVHIPARSWCWVCVRSKFTDDPHYKAGHERTGDEVQIDYYFLGQLSILNMVHMNSQAIHGIMGPKGTDAYMVKTAVATIENWGLDRIVLKHDQEASITALAREIKAQRKAPTMVETAQRANHQGVGGVERANEELGKQIRALLFSVGDNYKRELPAEHGLLPWLIRHAGWQLNRFTVHGNGKTTYEVLKGRPYRGELVNFAECVWARDPTPTSKLQPRWHAAVWLGKTEVSDEHLVAGPTRTTRVRTVRRRPEGERFVLEELDKFAGVPWDMHRAPQIGIVPAGAPQVEPNQQRLMPPPPPPPVALPAAGPEALVPPAMVGPAPPAGPGGAGLRSTYITRALIDKYGWTPMCPRCVTGMGSHSEECRKRIENELRKEEMARAAAEAAPSSAAAGAAPTPAAAGAAPGPAAGAGDGRPGSSGDASMAPRDDQGEASAKRPRQTAAITVGSLAVGAFVEINPCTYEGLDQQSHEELETVTEIESCEPLEIGMFEVSPVEPAAITVLPDTEKHVYDARSGKELPRDLVRRGREAEIEEMRRHGVFEEVRVAESRGKVVRFKWVEDLRTKDGVAMEINTYGREDCNAGTPPIAIVRRKIRWTGKGFVWIGDTKHVTRCVELLGLTECKPADTPGSKATGKSVREALDPLPHDEAKLYQQVAGLVNYVAVDRPDIQFAVKVILTDMGKPTVISMLRLRRCVRYLHGRRELGWFYEKQEMPKAVLYETDSDWAEDEITRKSTSSVYGFFGSHLLETQVASQPVVALSSGEAEFYAIGRGAASAIMMRQFYQQCGIEVASKVHSDSNAGRAIATRIGSGKVRHLQIRDLWVQERVRLGELQLGRVDTESNRSDLGTKHLDGKRVLKLLEMSNLRLLTKGLAAGVGVTFTEAAEHGDKQCSAAADDEVESNIGSIVLAMIVFIIALVLAVKGAVECTRGAVQLFSSRADGTAKPEAASKDAPEGHVVSRAAAIAAPERVAEGRNLGSEYFGKMLAEATVAELKEELRWRKLPVSGLKADLIVRLTRDDGQHMASSEGLAAAAWAARLVPGRVPIRAFRSDASLGSHLGPAMGRGYEEVGTAGEGAYGLVLKCRSRASGELVAVKRFRELESEDEEAARVMQREIDILRSLRHENIVEMRDVFRDQGVLHILRKYVEECLVGMLDKHPSGLGSDATRRLTAQLARAVGHCHDRGVIHRDVKPDNVLVSAKDGRLGASLRLRQRVPAGAQRGPAHGLRGHQVVPGARAAGALRRLRSRGGRVGAGVPPGFPKGI
ncbi:unnamed protein product [Prorocentrum cordatum]|uniref:Cyclin-dependent kinase 2 homolog n=1 Tax=Prorocentrum cordatum TaxID=2364126 RepID=A0ABN9UFY6_9DINO|nr:unnamed protein product [Polarella glacialis]